MDVETLDGDTLDTVIYRQFGRVDEQLLADTYALNPEIAEYGVILPAGVKIRLPEVATVEVIPTIKLWN